MGPSIMSTSRHPPTLTTIKLLWSRSAGRCNYPDCRIECTRIGNIHDPSVVLGEMAHIVGHSPMGPRGDALYPSRLLNEYDNLLLLCANHHLIVDGQVNSFTKEILRVWKNDHELWVRQSLEKDMVKVTFLELDEICSHIVNAPEAPDRDMQLTDPSAKLEKNNLSGGSRFLLTLGIANFDLVHGYIEAKIQTDYKFPERLKSGFLAEYRKEFRKGIRGDELFEDLRLFASGTGSDFLRQAAGLAVLCYLFQTCEIFER